MRFALDADTGHPLWRFQTGAAIAMPARRRPLTVPRARRR